MTDPAIEKTRRIVERGISLAKYDPIEACILMTTLQMALTRCTREEIESVVIGGKEKSEVIRERQRCNALGKEFIELRGSDGKIWYI